MRKLRKLRKTHFGTYLSFDPSTGSGSEVLGGGLSRRRRNGDELLGSGDGVLAGEYGSASGFRADDVDKKRIIGEVDCCAEGHAGNA